jgi:mono/diheme cytochrome c family protein
MSRKLLTSALVCLAAIGCRQDMHDQRKLEPLEESKFWSDGRASRDPVPGSIARGKLKADRHLFFGREELAEARSGPDDGSEGALVDTFPFPVDKHVLERGRERFDVFCAPCHARTGDGDGMIVRRGFRRPPSLHDDKIRDARVGHLYDVIRRGFGVMPAYETQIPVRDRWAIVAYLRALQLHRRAALGDVPEAEKKRLAGEGEGR